MGAFFVFYKPYIQSFEGVKRALFQKCAFCVGSGAKLLTFCAFYAVLKGTMFNKGLNLNIN